MRRRSVLFLATSAIAFASASCAAALSWDGFDDGVESEGGSKETGPKDDAGGADTNAPTDGPTVDSPSQVPIAPVQENSAVDPEGSNSATLSVKFSQAAQIQGNLNVVAVAWFEPTASITSVTDSVGNTYALAAGPTHQAKTTGSSDDILHAIYYAGNIKAAAANTNSVTVTLNTGGDGIDIRIVEYAGLDRSSPFDKGGANKGVGTTATTDPITPSVPRALLVSAGATWEYFHNAGPDYIRRSRSTDFSLLQDRIVSVQQPYTSSMPVLDEPGTAPASGEWVLQIAVFK